MTRNPGTDSKLFDDEIPTADAGQSHRRTIEDSGWWRAHFLVLASAVLGVMLGLSLLVLIQFSSYGSTFYWVTANAFGYVVWGSLVVFFGSALATFYGFYAEAKLLRRSNADWQPRWWLYVVATPILSVFVTSLIYLAQRERHVGIRWEQLAVWR